MGVFLTFLCKFIFLNKKLLNLKEKKKNDDFYDVILIWTGFQDVFLSDWKHEIEYYTIFTMPTTFLEQEKNGFGRICKKK